ncbi:terminase small subunit [Microbulbifer thermotolerans]|uniref:Terminase small subunit n=1 Tax=Microbulbifer thermotolerans TaxID=252514 RepID=A0AB35I1H1_MICTH|nr:terminase small subunit [Microbulbifer thermotolerans]MCX2780416.1 terminase small subunit [Microbulbifer thermotolerans]MCX2802250.1 terminase small subunit [Microbulbifer thermotolerans]MCX2805912.1 terminase small subunit [Microbulbifer thermotolerans]
MTGSTQKPLDSKAKQPSPDDKDGRHNEQPGTARDYWLNKRQVCESLGISTTAFDKWRVEPVARIGNCNYYDVRSIVDNRVDNALSRHTLERSSSASEGLDPAAEQARLAKERADSIALKNARARGELIPAEVAGLLFGKIGAEMAAVLDALPAKIKRRAPGLTATDLEFIKTEIVRAQNAAAEVDRYLDELIDEINGAADAGD